MPYLPFVLDPSGQRETPRADTVRRARYDFIRTLVELFHERFLATYVDWAQANGLLARMQAYGRETHPLDGSLLDLPEGETLALVGPRPHRREPHRREQVRLLGRAPRRPRGR